MSSQFTLVTEITIKAKSLISRACLICFLTLLASGHGSVAWATAFNESPLAQRAADGGATYKQAVSHARKGQMSRSEALQKTLADYPLPYVAPPHFEQ